MTDFSQRLKDPDRLRALAATELVDSEPDPAFDRLTELARLAIGAPVVLVSLVTDEKQFFKSACGLPQPAATDRETPLSHSFCQHVVCSREVLVIEDARKHPLVRDNFAIRDLNVIAYLGVPLVDDRSQVLGSFCAIHGEPHPWTTDEIAIMTHLAGAVMSEIRLRENIQSAESSRLRLSAILESTGEAIYGINANGVCTFFNKACLRVLGADADEELIGKNMHDLIHHSHADGEAYPLDQCRIRRSYLDGVGVRVDNEVFWRLDGTPFPVEYTSYPKILAGKIAGAVVTFVDITRRIEEKAALINAKETAETARRSAERATRQKSRFLANVSHEIRTPMNAILGFSELLEGTVESPKSRQYVAAIRSGGAALLALINDILDLSKIESGKLTANFEPCDVREAVESVRLLLSQQAAEKNIDLQACVSAEVPDVLVLDRLRLRQIMLNLLSNAIKFTSKGGVNLRTWTEKRVLDEQHVDLYLAVADTGIGIPDDQLKSIFKPFEQVDTAPDTIDEGTGLGLSIASRLAKLIGGRLEIDSALDEGSTFTLVLEKVAISTEFTAIETAAPRNCNLDLLEPATILVVDDNAFNRDLAAGYFEDSHHTVHFAKNGAEGLEAARKLNPDIILMDVRMPVMNGLEAREAAKTDDSLSGIPMIAVTASSMMDDSARLRRVFDGYVRKPFSRAELFTELSSFLNGGPAATPDLPAAESKATAYKPTDAEIAKWQPLILELTKLQESTWRKLRQTMAIGEVTEFAKRLQHLGNESQCQLLIDFAQTLHEQAEGFALTSMEATMDDYPQLIEALRELLAGIY